MAKRKRNKSGSQSKKDTFKFEKIVPLSDLFPEKLLKEKINDIKKNPFLKKLGIKVKSSMKVMGEQAAIFKKSAKGLAVRTSAYVKIAQFNSHINKLYTAIGEEVYEQTKNQIKLPERESNIPKYISKINEIESEISVLEKKLPKKK